ncbi:MAG: SRPBCC family protein [Myxococcales bacterium]|nr:SRPBCC family protein [Myxococcales bacterium]
MKNRLATALVASVLTLFPLVAAAQGGVEGLSSYEQSRLAAGHLVARAERAADDPGRLGGHSWQVVDLPPDVVWSAVRDASRYRDILPGVQAVRVASAHDDAMRVEVVQGRGSISVRYHMLVRFNDARRLAMFRLDTTKRNDVQAAWGFVRVRPYAGGKSLVSFGALTDLEQPTLTSTFVRASIDRALLAVPASLKAYVEGAGRDRYVNAEG